MAFTVAVAVWFNSGINITVASAATAVGIAAFAAISLLLLDYLDCL